MTARVVVNRFWKLFFGTGLSRTLDDPSQGEWPTHPALLDWPAVQFRESGWDMKPRHRVDGHSSGVSPKFDRQQKWGRA